MSANGDPHNFSGPCWCGAMNHGFFPEQASQGPMVDLFALSQMVKTEIDRLSVKRSGPPWNRWNFVRRVDAYDAVDKAFAQYNTYPTFKRHPLTCGLCQWGRVPENHDQSAYVRHMAEVHGSTATKS